MKPATVLIIPVLICLLGGVAHAYEPAMMRSTGELIDAKGKIIAVPNPNDPRNTEKEKYYSAVNSDGEPEAKSRFILTVNPRNPLGGHVQYDLSKNESPANPDGDATVKVQEPVETKETPGNAGITTNSYNNSDINQPRYNQDYTPEVLYK